jgi:hypothetical protein
MLKDCTTEPPVRADPSPKVSWTPPASPVPPESEPPRVCRPLDSGAGRLFVGSKASVDVVPVAESVKVTEL